MKKLKAKPAREISPQRQVVVDLLKKFPKAATRTLARMAYEKHPEVFTDTEGARSVIRCIRGASGAGKASSAIPEFNRGPQPCNVAPFPKLPEGKRHFDDSAALKIHGPSRVLVLADAHIPYHDKNAIVAALQYGKRNGVDTILLNGDTADFFAVSFWEKDPRKRNLAEELKTVQAFMETLRDEFPKARIIFKVGNHELRWQRFMFVKAPELLGVPEFELPSLLSLNSDDELVDSHRLIQLGHLNVLHGHEYRFAISNPVNPARGLFLRCKAYAMCGHFHQISAHSEKSVDGQKIATWSTGCLCDLRPDYSPYNNWSHGCAFVEVFSDGRFQVENKLISGGKVF